MACSKLEHDLEFVQVAPPGSALHLPPEHVRSNLKSMHEVRCFTTAICQRHTVTHPQQPLAGTCLFLYLTNRRLLLLFSYVSQDMMFNHTCAVQSEVCGACLIAAVTAAGVVVSGLPGSEGGIRTVFHRLRELPAQIMSSSTQVGVTLDATYTSSAVLCHSRNNP